MITEVKSSSEKWRRASMWATSLAIICMAISITATHISLFFSFFFFILYFIFSYQERVGIHLNEYHIKNIFYLCKNISIDFYNRIKSKNIPKPFQAGLLLYSVLFITDTVHFFQNPEENLYFTKGIQEILSGLFLLFFGILVWYIAQKPQEASILWKAMFVCIALLITTGIVSIFLENQLATSLLGKAPRHQSFVTQLGGVNMYRPHGFMSLSLTYAGLLMLFLPLALSSFLYFLFKEKKIYFSILFLLISISICCLLWLNGSRSAGIATLLCTPLTFYFFYNRFSQHTPKKIGKRTILSYSSHFVIGIFYIIVFLLFFFEIKNPSQKGTYNRAVNYRNLIWNQSGHLFLKNPFLGVGIENYTMSTWNEWNQYLSKLPKHIANSENTNLPFPLDHAHNDLLHLAVTSGFIGVLFFLYLIYCVFRDMLRNRTKWGPYLLLGCVTFFIAGLAQCYFLDDEVVILFWVLIAMADKRSQTEGNINTTKKLINLKKTQQYLTVNQKFYNDILEKISFFFAFFALLSTFISISITQINIAISITFCVIQKVIVYFIDTKPKLKTRHNNIPNAFICAIGLFFFVLVSEIFHSIESFSATSLLTNLIYFFKKSDLYLMSFGILIWSFYKKKARIQTMGKGFIILIVLLIFSGVISVFFEQQLSSLLLSSVNMSSNPPVYDRDNQPQNLLFTLFGIPLYSPTGFMSTRLTYAGMLIIVLPFLMGKVILYILKKRDGVHATLHTFPHEKIEQTQSLNKNEIESNQQLNTNIFSVRFILIIIYGSISLFGLGVLWLTGVRSAIIGLAVALSLLFLMLLKKDFLSFQYWKGFFLQKKKEKGYYRKIIYILFLLFTLFISISIYFDFHTRFLRPVLRTANFGRPLMWTESWGAIRQNPIFGVGHSKYSSVKETWRNTFLSENPDAWYFMHFIPTGHVHSDILDMAYLHGIFPVLFYLGIVFFILRQMLFLRSKKDTLREIESISLLCGCVGLFVASLFQCYFKDDEVILIFWVSLALGSIVKTSKTEKIKLK